MIIKRGVLFLLAALFAVTGCGAEPAQKTPKDQPTEEGRHVDKANGFSIKFPKDWEKKENVMGTTVVGISPQEGPGDNFRENVNVVVESVPKDTTLDDYVKAARAMLKKLATDFKEIEAGAQKVGGAGAYRIVYDHRAGTVRVRVCAHILVKGARAYIITASAAPEAYGKYKDRFEEIAQSFKLD